MPRTWWVSKHWEFIERLNITNSVSHSHATNWMSFETLRIHWAEHHELIESLHITTSMSHLHLTNWLTIHMPRTGCVFKHSSFIQHLNITNSSSPWISPSQWVIQISRTQWHIHTPRTHRVLAFNQINKLSHPIHPSIYIHNFHVTNSMTHPHATNLSSPYISSTQHIISPYTSLNLLTQFPCHELNYSCTPHELVESLNITNSNKLCDFCHPPLFT